MSTQTMSDYGIVTEAGTVRFERRLPGPIERVWAYLTESGKRGLWFASGDMELRVGGRVELRFRHRDLTPHAETPPDRYRKVHEGVTTAGRITACEPPRLLSYVWDEGGPCEDSEVTFALTPSGDDVLLVLTHRRLTDRATTVNISGGWHAHLAILADVLAGQEPAPFWASHARLEAEYERRTP